MSLALKIGNEDSQVQGFIYLDAVTVYTKALSGKVTSFPVDSGVQISDHFIPANQRFSIEGVISESDITGMSDNVRLNNDKPMNARPQPTSVIIDGGEGSAPSFVPGVVQQFFDTKKVTVTSDVWTSSITPQVEGLLTELMRGVYYNQANRKWRNKMTMTTLYEMDGLFFSSAHTDLVITDVNIREDAETGEGLTLTLELEKIRIVGIEQVGTPRLAVAKKVAKTEKKGTPNTATGTVNGTDTTGDKTLAPKADIDSRLSQAIATAQRGPVRN